MTLEELDSKQNTLGQDLDELSRKVTDIEKDVPYLQSGSQEHISTENEILQRIKRLENLVEAIAKEINITIDNEEAE